MNVTCAFRIAVGGVVSSVAVAGVMTRWVITITGSMKTTWLANGTITFIDIWQSTHTSTHAHTHLLKGRGNCWPKDGPNRPCNGQYWRSDANCTHTHTQIFPTTDSLPASRLTPRTKWLDRFFWASRFLLLVSSLPFCCLVPCTRLNWLPVSFSAHVNIVHRIVTVQRW